MKRYASSKILRSIALLAVALLALIGSGIAHPAWAAPEPEHASQPPPTKPRAPGQIQLSVRGAYGPAELVREGDAFKGSFDVKNLGPGELDVTRVSVRTSPTDPRAPLGVEIGRAHV